MLELIESRVLTRRVSLMAECATNKAERFMATATQSSSPNDSNTPPHQQMMPWVLITEIYWMSYKLLERRFYHLGVSASQARVLAVLHFATEPIKPSLVATLL